MRCISLHRRHLSIAPQWELCKLTACISFNDRQLDKLTTVLLHLEINISAWLDERRNGLGCTNLITELAWKLVGAPSLCTF